MSRDVKNVAPLVMPADPWLWEDLDADAWQELAFRSHDFGPTSPVMQYAAVMRCKSERLAIENGDGFAVLACVRTCGTSGLTMPDWLVSAFNRKYDAVLDCRASSWDDPKAFGAPYPKGTNLNALRKRRIGRLRMWSGVVQAVQTGQKVNKIFFERLGEPYGYGKTLAEELYREALKINGLFDPVAARKSKKSAEENTVMDILGMAAIARECGSNRIDMGNGMLVSYHNFGPNREPAIKATPPIKKTKKPATYPKIAGLR